MIHSIIFIILGGLAVVSVLDNEMIAIACFILLSIWFPYFADPYNYNILAHSKSAAYYDYYNYADKEDYTNPLWIGKKIRKNRKFDFVLSKYKEISFCRIVSMILFVVLYTYMFFFRRCDYTNPFLEIFLIFMSVVLVIVWHCMMHKFMAFYRKEYEYTETSEGIWLPFRFITEQPRKGRETTFRCWYHVTFPKLKSNLIKQSEKQGYHLMEACLEQEKEVLFFKKENNRELFLFGLIHLKKFHFSNLEDLNKIFAEYWKAEIEDKHSTYWVNFTFLLCVDEKTEELKKFFLDYNCIQQKEGRHRLAAVLLYDADDALTILSNNTHGKSSFAYDIMYKELLNLLQMSEDDRYMNYYFKE